MPDDLRQRLWRVAVYHGGGIVDARRLQQTGADLVQLDAIAADFDLVVGSALKTQFAVETQGDLVAGQVCTRAIVCTVERVGDDAIGGLVGAPSVAEEWRSA